MSANDFLDATQNLLKLKITKTQLREIAIVVVASCAQETTFNKYYAYLAENLIKVNLKLKFAFQYALWDHFKLLDNYSLRKIANLAKLLFFLIEKRIFGLQVLRGLDIETLNAHQKILLRIILKELYYTYFSN